MRGIFYPLFLTEVRYVILSIFYPQFLDMSCLAYFTLISYLDRRVRYVVFGIAMEGQVPFLGKFHATQLTGLGFLLLVLTQHMPGRTWENQKLTNSWNTSMLSIAIQKTIYHSETSRCSHLKMKDRLRRCRIMTTFQLYQNSILDVLGKITSQTKTWTSCNSTWSTPPPPNIYFSQLY